VSAKIASQFDEYKDDDSRVIYDVDEERELKELIEAETADLEQLRQSQKRKLFEGFNLERK
jgi:hypothetical protein